MNGHKTRGFAVALAVVAVSLLAPQLAVAQLSEMAPLESLGDVKEVYGEAIVEALSDFDFDKKVLLAPIIAPHATQVQVVELEEDGREAFAPTLEISVVVSRTDGDVLVDIQHGYGPCMTGPVPEPKWLESCVEGAMKQREEMRKTAWFVSVKRKRLGDIKQQETMIPPPP